MIEFLNMLRDISWLFFIWMAIALVVVLIKELLARGSVEKVRKECEERINDYQKRIKELHMLLESKEKQHREELKEYAGINEMLKKLREALNAGALKLTCPEHPNASVTLLIDGTIICSEGHRLCPRETEK